MTTPHKSPHPAGFVIADGNHRISKAFYDDLQTQPVHRLSQAEAKRYLA